MEMNRNNIGSAAWGFRALELPDQLALAAKLGFATHELGIANADTDIPADASAETVARVRQLYKDNGLRLCCAATGNDFTGDDPAAQLEKVKTVIRLCQNLGVEKLRIFTGFTPISQMNEAKWAQLLDCLKEAAAEAETCGVKLCVETHGAVEALGAGVRHIRSTSTQLPDLARVLAAAPVSLVFDPGNLNAVGEDPVALFGAVKDRIGYAHLKDFAPHGDALRPAAVGDGSTPWAALKPLLNALDVPLLYEYELCEDLEEGLVKSHESWKGA
jgi:sugar phosphate isomerase/epimerase